MNLLSGHGGRSPHAEPAHYYGRTPATSQMIGLAFPDLYVALHPEDVCPTYRIKLERGVRLQENARFRVSGLEPSKHPRGGLGNTPSQQGCWKRSYDLGAGLGSGRGQSAQALERLR